MLGKHATLRFFADLCDLAPDADRYGEVTVPFDAPRSVKDAIESCGVPHTEVDLVLVGGASVGFDHLLEEGDRVSVYPPFASLEVDAVSKVRPDPLPPRFVADVHLGRLAERLRLLGFDTAYDNDADDAALVEWAADEERWLLTRDRGLLMRAAVSHGYLVRSNDPTDQTVEVLRRFELRDRIDAFSRCTACGAALEPVAKDEVVAELEPGTRRDHDEFVRCTGCRAIYWPGSHLERLESFVAEVTERARRQRAP